MSKKYKKIAKNVEAKALPYTVVMLLLFASVSLVLIQFKDNTVKASTTNQFNYYKKLTLDHNQVPDSLTNFPILVNLSSDVGLAANALDNGFDIAFFDSTNTTQYDHEIEYFDGTTGQLIAWVEVDTVSEFTDTVVYMYYGNASLGNQEDVDGTWANGYVGVWHMSNLLDSTSNSYDLTAVGGATTSDVGVVGNSSHIDGASQFFKNNNVFSADFPDSITLEIFTKHDNTWDIENAIGAFDGDGSGTSNDQLYIQIKPTTNMLRYITKGGGTSNTYENNGWYLNYNASKIWHYVGFTYTKNVVSHGSYDGKTGTGGVASPEISGASSRFFIGAGARLTNGELFFDGYIDEARVSNVARNDSWLVTTYNCIHNGTSGGFFILGPQHDTTGSTVVTAIGLTGGRITWVGVDGTTVWCNEYVEVNMSVNASNNITDILVWIGDLNNTGPTEYINASNMSLYVSSDNVTYGVMGTFADGGSNISINSTTWNVGTMGANPFISGGITNRDESIFFRVKLAIPSGTSNDLFYSISVTQWDIWYGHK